MENYHCGAELMESLYVFLLLLVAFIIVALLGFIAGVSMTKQELGGEYEAKKKLVNMQLALIDNIYGRRS